MSSQNLMFEGDMMVMPHISSEGNCIQCSRKKVDCNIYK